MLNFCTLFDANYLSRGLVMYESLLKNSSDFHLYILSFDNDSLQYLRQANYEHLTVISLTEFEDQELLRVKKDRTIAEYCWTCTPSLILYCLKVFGLPSCTYIDADMVFYDDPKILVDEDPKASIIITEHRYTKEYDVSATHGIYCVQFMYFKNNEEGMEALKWWRQRCLEWCHAYLEDGKFGDQKYLDDWTTRFSGVHVMQHEGGGVAPWNIQQYNFRKDDGKIQLQLTGASHWHPLIFFHYHGLKFYSNQKVSLTGTMYEMDEQATNLIFVPYVRSLVSRAEQIKQKGAGFEPNGARGPAPGNLNIFAQFLKERLLLVFSGKLSILQADKFNFRKYYHYYRSNRI
jgi:hypothetical protein